MRWIAVAVLGGFGLVAGCLPAPRSQHCAPQQQGEGWLCPAEQACALPPAYCGEPALVDACLDASGQYKADFDSCMPDGRCRSGICEQCSVDLEGCPTPMWSPMALPLGSSNFSSLWVAARGDAYAGDQSGTLLHYDGTSWSKAEGFPDSVAGAVSSIWGSGPIDVFALISNGTVFHFDGRSWSDVTPSPPVSELSALGGSESDHVAFAVSLFGDVIRFDGTSWSNIHMGSTPPGTPPLSGIWGSSANDVFAVGKGGLVMHYDGAMWNTIVMYSTTAPTLNAVWGSNATNVFAVGNPTSTITIVSSTNGWMPIMFPPGSIPAYPLKTLWGSSAVDVYGGGQHGTIVHFDGTSWSTQTTPSSTDIAVISGSSATDVFAAGVGGIWRYTGP